jgi:hypothetical protein
MIPRRRRMERECLRRREGREKLRCGWNGWVAVTRTSRDTLNSRESEDLTMEKKRNTF